MALLTAIFSRGPKEKKGSFSLFGRELILSGWPPRVEASLPPLPQSITTPSLSSFLSSENDLRGPSRERGDCRRGQSKSKRETAPFRFQCHSSPGDVPHVSILWRGLRPLKILRSPLSKNGSLLPSLPRGWINGIWEKGTGALG